MLSPSKTQKKQLSLDDGGFRTWLPNALTLARFALVFVVLAGMGFYVFASSALLTLFGITLTFFSFVSAALFDFLDGCLARHWNVMSTFGSIMDPVADKALMAGGFIAVLITMPQALLWIVYPAAALIILRDIMVSGLRKYTAAKGGSLPPSRLAKWKTLFEMGALALLLGAFFWAALIGAISGEISVSMMTPEALKAPLGQDWGLAFILQNTGFVVLWLATFLSVLSGFLYARSVFQGAKRIV